MHAETDRLLVRPFAEDDAAGLHEILSDSEVMRYIEAPFSAEQTRAFLRENGLSRPPRIFAVIRKSDGALIGQLILHPWDEAATELGWILRRDCWGRGYAGELTEAIIAEADRDLVIECSPAQSATRHIAEKHGFRPCGESGGLLVFRYRTKKEL